MQYDLGLCTLGLTLTAAELSNTVIFGKNMSPVKCRFQDLCERKAKQHEKALDFKVGHDTPYQCAQ
jgi:hypothetical protein